MADTGRWPLASFITFFFWPTPQNGDFAEITNVPLEWVNQLEVAALLAIDFRCCVNAAEYTEVFFKLRSIAGVWAVLAKSSKVSAERRLSAESLKPTTADSSTATLEKDSGTV